MGTRSADPLNAAVRRENAGSTWGAPGIDGANNKVSSAFMPIWADWAAESSEAHYDSDREGTPNETRHRGVQRRGRQGERDRLSISLSIYLALASFFSVSSASAC